MFGADSLLHGWVVGLSAVAPTIAGSSLSVRKWEVHILRCDEHQSGVFQRRVGPGGSSPSQNHQGWSVWFSAPLDERSPAAVEMLAHGDREVDRSRPKASTGEIEILQWHGGSKLGHPEAPAGKRVGQSQRRILVRLFGKTGHQDLPGRLVYGGLRPAEKLPEVGPDRRARKVFAGHAAAAGHPGFADGPARWEEKSLEEVVG